MLIVKNFGNADWLSRSETLARVIIPELEALVVADLLYLRTHHAPSLYDSGVVYREEPKDLFHHLATGERVEEFAHIAPVLARKWGDCDDLGPGRVAELRRDGEDAKIRVQWKTMPSGKLFHVLTRRPPGSVRSIDPRYQYVDDGNPVVFGERIAPADRARFGLVGDGSVLEDPSRALGMNQPGGVPILGPRSRNQRIYPGLAGVKFSGAPLLDLLKEI